MSQPTARKRRRRSGSDRQNVRTARSLSTSHLDSNRSIVVLSDFAVASCPSTDTPGACNVCLHRLHFSDAAGGRQIDKQNLITGGRGGQGGEGGGGGGEGEGGGGERGEKESGGGRCHQNDVVLARCKVVAQPSSPDDDTAVFLGRLVSASKVRCTSSGLPTLALIYAQRRHTTESAAATAAASASTTEEPKCVYIATMPYEEYARAAASRGSGTLGSSQMIVLQALKVENITHTTTTADCDVHMLPRLFLCDGPCVVALEGGGKGGKGGRGSVQQQLRIASTRGALSSSLLLSTQSCSTATRKEPQLQLSSSIIAPEGAGIGGFGHLLAVGSLHALAAFGGAQSDDIRAAAAAAALASSAPCNQQAALVAWYGLAGSAAASEDYSAHGANLPAAFLAVPLPSTAAALPANMPFGKRDSLAATLSPAVANATTKPFILHDLPGEYASHVTSALLIGAGTCQQQCILALPSSDGNATLLLQARPGLQVRLLEAKPKFAPAANQQALSLVRDAFGHAHVHIISADGSEGAVVNLETGALESKLSWRGRGGHSVHAVAPVWPSEVSEGSIISPGPCTLIRYETLQTGTAEEGIKFTSVMPTEPSVFASSNGSSRAAARHGPSPGTQARSALLTRLQELRASLSAARTRRAEKMALFSRAEAAVEQMPHTMVTHKNPVERRGSIMNGLVPLWPEDGSTMPTLASPWGGTGAGRDISGLPEQELGGVPTLLCAEPFLAPATTAHYDASGVLVRLTNRGGKPLHGLSLCALAHGAISTSVSRRLEHPLLPGEVRWVEIFLGTAGDAGLSHARTWISIQAEWTTAVVAYPTASTGAKAKAKSSPQRDQLPQTPQPPAGDIEETSVPPSNQQTQTLVVCLTRLADLQTAPPAEGLGRIGRIDLATAVAGAAPENGPAELGIGSPTVATLALAVRQVSAMRASHNAFVAMGFELVKPQAIPKNSAMAPEDEDAASATRNHSADSNFPAIAYRAAGSSARFPGVCITITPWIDSPMYCNLAFKNVTVHILPQIVEAFGHHLPSNAVLSWPTLGTRLVSNLPLACVELERRITATLALSRGGESHVGTVAALLGHAGPKLCAVYTNADDLSFSNLSN